MKINYQVADLMSEKAASRPNDSGIWTFDGRIGFGVVILLETSSGDLLLLKKASKSDYEFSGLFALPGGMIRAQQTADHDFPSDLERTIYDRLENEAGIFEHSLPHIAPAANTPLVTSYTAKGSRRYTIVLPYLGQFKERANVESRSSSVQEPRWLHWREVIPLLAQTAPANRLVIASYLWQRMDRTQRRDIAVSIDEAVQVCRGWACEVGLDSFQPKAFLA
jgi:hypothetical protein